MKVSVITAVFNGRDTIRDAIESVASQSGADIEHVVVDGASTDGTAEILEGLRDRLDVLVSEKDEGIYDALNKGIGLASGDVVGFLHADDLFADDRVVSKIAAAFEDPEVEAVYGDLEYVSKSDTRRVIRHWRAGEYSVSSLVRGWMPPHPTFYVRRRVYERLGAFDTTHRIAADYDCMLRFLSRGNLVPRYIPGVMVRMRVGGMSNRSLSNVLLKSREDYRALRRNRVGGLGTLGLKNLRKLRQFLG